MSSERSALIGVGTPRAQSALFNTILINVTSIFRDSEAWTYLQREVIPEVLAEHGPEDEIRVWSAGCSSGEEAYSLAITFAEAPRDARSGLFPAKALEPISDALREKYFEQNGARYGFRSDLHRRVILGRHDITRDAPISRLTCSSAATL